MSTQYVLMMVAMAVYLIGMIVLGILFSGKNRSTADFYLGGRKLGPCPVQLLEAGPGEQEACDVCERADEGVGGTHR